MMLGQLFPETGEIGSLFDTVIRSNFSLLDRPKHGKAELIELRETIWVNILILSGEEFLK